MQYSVWGIFKRAKLIMTIWFFHLTKKIWNDIYSHRVIYSSIERIAQSGSEKRPSIAEIFLVSMLAI